MLCHSYEFAHSEVCLHSSVKYKVIPNVLSTLLTMRESILFYCLLHSPLKDFYGLWILKSVSLLCERYIHITSICMCMGASYRLKEVNHSTMDENLYQHPIYDSHLATTVKHAMVKVHWL